MTTGPPPIRIGVNGGSLEKHILAKYGAPVPEAMVESALYHVRLLEKFDFDNIVISIKSSNVPRMMEAYRQLSAVTDYPLHVGVTEAGTYQMGLLKSGMGIGGLLMEGIGDTIRVSLAADPEKEVEAGYNILRAVGFPVAGPWSTAPAKPGRPTSALPAARMRHCCSSTASRCASWWGITSWTSSWRRFINCERNFDSGSIG